MTELDPVAAFNQRAEALANIEFLEPIVNLLAKVRKLGMDLLFPLSTQDKVLACIFVSAQLIDKPAAHREVIEMVMTMKDCMNYPELDVISKTKIRGMLAFLKHSEILVPYVHGNDPVKLQLSPAVPNFQTLREKHDLFMFKFLVRNRVAIPKHLLGQVLWEPSRIRSGDDGRLQLINQFIVSLRNMMTREEFDSASGHMVPKYVKVLASVPEKFERAVDSLPVIENDYGGFKSNHLNSANRGSNSSCGQFYDTYAPQAEPMSRPQGNKLSPRSLACDGHNTNYLSRPSNRYNGQMIPSHHSITSHSSPRNYSVTDTQERDFTTVQSREMYREQNYPSASSRIQNTSPRESSSYSNSSHQNYNNHPYNRSVAAISVNPDYALNRSMMPPPTVSHNSMITSHLMTEAVPANSLPSVTQLKSNNPLSTYDALCRGVFMETAESSVPLSDETSGMEALHCQEDDMAGLGSTSQDSFFNHTATQQAFSVHNSVNFSSNPLNAQEIEKISLQSKDSSSALKADAPAYFPGYISTASPTLGQLQHSQMFENQLLNRRNAPLSSQAMYNSSGHVLSSTTSYHNHIQSTNYHPQTGQHIIIAPQQLNSQIDVRTQYSVIDSPRVHAQSVSSPVSSTSTLNRQSQTHLQVLQPQPQHLHQYNERGPHITSYQSHTEIDCDSVDVNSATYFRGETPIFEQFIKEVTSSEETLKTVTSTSNFQQKDRHSNQTNYNTNSTIMTSSKIMPSFPIDIPQSYRQTSHNAMLWADESSAGMSQTASNSSLNSESARNSVTTYQSFGYNN